MNKVITAMVMGAVLAGSGAALAADGRQQLAECKEQLTVIYGEDARVRLRSMGVGRNASLNLSVHVPGEASVRVTCRRGADGQLELMDRDGVALRSPLEDGATLTAL